MITRLIWTSLSAVPRKAIEFNHSFIFKHNQQSHVCGMVVPETKLVLFISLHLFRKFNNLLCTSFSNIFENNGSREIDL